jgi:hypothetical protein
MSTSERTNGAGADHRDTIAQVRQGVPDTVYRCFEIRGQHSARWGNGVRQHVNVAGRYDEVSLMRIQREYRSAGQRIWAALDPPDAGVAIFDGRRELALLKGGAHPDPFALGDATGKHERLRAATDAAVQGSHHDVAGGWGSERLRADLTATRCGHPECSDLLGHRPTF